MRYLFFIAISIGLLGCAYDLVEEVTFHENREATGRLRLDFGESMKGKYRDQVFAMVTGAATEILGSMGDSAKQKLNLEHYRNADPDTIKLLVEMALDTLPSAHKDSIYASLVQRDTFNILSADERDRLASFAYELMRRMVIRINIDMPQSLCYFEVEAIKVPWDELESYKISTIISKLDQDTSFQQFRFISDFSLKWMDRKIVRGEQLFAKTGDKEISEDDDQLTAQDSISVNALKNSHYIIRYNFPGKSRKNSNPYFKPINKGMSVEFRESLYDISRKKINSSAEISYE